MEGGGWVEKKACEASNVKTDVPREKKKNNNTTTTKSEKINKRTPIIIPLLFLSLSSHLR